MRAVTRVPAQFTSADMQRLWCTGLDRLQVSALPTPVHYKWPFYSDPDLLEGGVSGYVSHISCFMYTKLSVRKSYEFFIRYLVIVLFSCNPAYMVSPNVVQGLY